MTPACKGPTFTKERTKETPPTKEKRRNASNDAAKTTVEKAGLKIAPNNFGDRTETDFTQLIHSRKLDVSESKAGKLTAAEFKALVNLLDDPGCSIDVLILDGQRLKSKQLKELARVLLKESSPVQRLHLCACPISPRSQKALAALSDKFGDLRLTKPDAPKKTRTASTAHLTPPLDLTDSDLDLNNKDHQAFIASQIVVCEEKACTILLRRYPATKAEVTGLRQIFEQARTASAQATIAFKDSDKTFTPSTLPAPELFRRATSWSDCLHTYAQEELSGTSTGVLHLEATDFDLKRSRHCEALNEFLQKRRKPLTVVLPGKLQTLAQIQALENIFISISAKQLHLTVMFADSNMILDSENASDALNDLQLSVH